MQKVDMYTMSYQYLNKASRETLLIFPTKQSKPFPLQEVFSPVRILHVPKVSPLNKGIPGMSKSSVNRG